MMDSILSVLEKICKSRSKVILLLIGCTCALLMLETLFLMKGSTSTSSSTVQTYLKQPLPFNKDISLIRYFDSKGFESKTLPNRSALWTKNVQFCIMFNSVISERSLGFLLSYYLQFFNNITVISGTKVITRPHFVPDSVQIFNCDSYYGWYQHKCLRICLENPASNNVEGFLYIADDMFIDITKLGHLNRTKLWTIPIKTFNYSHLERASKSELHQQWFWFGVPRYVEYSLQKIINRLPKKWMEALKRNAGFPSKFEVHAASDIYYIPVMFVPQMVEVVSFIINTTELFCEVALPLSVGIISHPSERQILIDGYLWGNQRTIQRKKIQAKVGHFVHPLKISQSDDLKLWRKLMNTQLKRATLSNRYVP